MADVAAPLDRPYDRDRDLEAVTRIWREIGWVDSDDEAALVEVFHEAGRTLVHEQAGSAESAVHVTRGSMRLQDVDLPLAAVTAVTTSHVARRQGAARRLLARMLAEEAADGAQVAALGIFDQGFYDRLGFGTGAYGHRFSFDPATLMVPPPSGVPVRVGPDDWAEVHACMLARQRSNGAVCLDDPRIVRAELGWQDGRPFGLGFRDAAGRLTHFVYGRAAGEHGPYEVTWMAYRSADELLELLSALASLSDQVHEVRLVEPPHLQLQDLLRQPFRERRKARRAIHHDATAWWQVRVLDPAGAIAALRLPGAPVTFNLDLHDPVADHVPDGLAWRGTAGRYVVTLGEESSCESGDAPGLPTLRCGVGPFSRLLFGVRDATSLAVTTDLDGPAELLAAIDRVLRLPPPAVGWDF